MTSTDAAFAGSIPQLYNAHLGPLLFQPYAEEVARRVSALQPRRILETAAGTGLVTEAIQRACPNADIVATDLNQAMIDVAAGRIRSDKVTFRQADALDLPFTDREFDVVVCQFGVMFYPDKVKGNAEVHRVLRDGGRYLAVIWDRLERNPASRIVHDAVASLHPEDPPSFLARTPFGYADASRIERDMRSAGFRPVEIETVELESEQVSARDAATGLVAGCPLASEIKERNPDGLAPAIDAAAAALQQLERNGRLDSRLSAHVVTAVK